MPKKPISVKFEIPYFTVSGIQVRYLKIMEKSGYQALPWVRLPLPASLFSFPSLPHSPYFSVGRHLCICRSSSAFKVAILRQNRGVIANGDRASLTERYGRTELIESCRSFQPQNKRRIKESLFLPENIADCELFFHLSGARQRQDSARVAVSGSSSDTGRPMALFLGGVSVW